MGNKIISNTLITKNSYISWRVTTKGSLRRKLLRYGPAIDVWSIGCIFGELLGMMKENAPTYLDRKPLFPGKSWFPLSPNNKLTEKRKGFPFSSTDQLSTVKPFVQSLFVLSPTSWNWKNLGCRQFWSKFIVFFILIISKILNFLFYSL